MSSLSTQERLHVSYPASRLHLAPFRDLSFSLPQRPAVVRTPSDGRKSDGRLLRDTWLCLTTPPEQASVLPAARSSTQKVSWRPLTQLTYGTLSRMGLYMSARLLAYRYALPLPAPGQPLPHAPEPVAPVTSRPVTGAPETFGQTVLCGIFFATCLGLSLFNVCQFARDTSRICPSRARISLILGLTGCALTTIGTSLAEFYQDKDQRASVAPTIVPSMLGFALLVIRLPHSFVASELVHGNTPTRSRGQFGTLMLPAGASLLAAGFFVKGQRHLPEWGADFLFCSGLSCAALASALPRTDLSRTRAENS